MDEVYVRELFSLPYKVKGATVKDAEGDYNVYLNGLLPIEKRVEALDHELAHIKEGHFYEALTACQIETEMPKKR